MDPRNKRLLDATTQLSARGYDANSKQLMINTIIRDSVYHRLLAIFPNLTRPLAFGREIIRHSVKHHIETTRGHPSIANHAVLHWTDLSKSRRNWQPWSSKELCAHGKVPGHRHYTSFQRRMKVCGLRPDMQDLARHLHGRRIFSKIDLVRAYHQIPIAPENVKKPRLRHPSAFSRQPTWCLGFEMPRKRVKGLLTKSREVSISLTRI